MFSFIPNVGLLTKISNVALLWYPRVSVPLRYILATQNRSSIQPNDMKKSARVTPMRNSWVVYLLFSGPLQICIFSFLPISNDSCCHHFLAQDFSVDLYCLECICFSFLWHWFHPMTGLEDHSVSRVYKRCPSLINSSCKSHLKCHYSKAILNSSKQM